MSIEEESSFDDGNQSFCIYCKAEIPNEGRPICGKCKEYLGLGPLDEEVFGK
jgi:predicted amidophosphoribosyltransferase